MRTQLGDITAQLEAARRGERGAVSRLWVRVTPQVRVMARRMLSKEALEHRIPASELLNETFLRLLSVSEDEPRIGALPFRNRRELFAAVARAMRRILIEQARARRRRRLEVDLEELPDVRRGASSWGWDFDLEALDRALGRFEAEPANAREAQIVHLRFFGGCSIGEIAASLGISEDTVKRDLRYAKAWLLRDMSQGGKR